MERILIYDTTHTHRSGKATMIKNYFKIALRNLNRHRFYSIINITGLAVGLACCLLIFFYISHENSYDRFHEHNEQLYRVLMVSNNYQMAVTSTLLAPALKDEFPEIEHSVRLYPDDGVILSGEQKLEETLLFVDPSFLEMFTFPLQRGNKSQVLQNPDDVVLSHKAALKYFGKSDPIGQPLSIRINETFHEFTVQAVAEPIPAASSIRFEILLSINKLQTIDHESFNNPSWGSLRPRTYVQLTSSEMHEGLEAKLPSFVEKHLPTNFQAFTSYRLQPLSEIHYGKEITTGLSPTGNPIYSFILAGIALLILLIACINFTTLSLGLSTTRVREVGVRKVTGARRIQLIRQFWGEAFIVSLLALIMGIGIVKLALPTFNSLTDTSLSFHITSGLMFVLVGLLVIVSLLAGSYPALYLSRLSPMSVLKGNVAGPRRNYVTQILVVAQFSLSIFLVSCMLLMSDQLTLLSEKNLGYDADQVIRIRAEYGSTWEGKRLLESYQTALADDPMVISLTGSTFELGELGAANNRFPLTAGTDSVPGYTINVTSDFVESLGLELVQGRDFSPEYLADTLRAVVVNQTLADAFGWEDPLEQQISSFQFRDAAVIGVIKDFNFESLHKPIEPVALYIDRPNAIWSIYARVPGENLASSVASLQDTWQEIAPNLPFEYTFLDQAVDQQYRSEQRWTALIRIASVIALFIAFLGLMGLASLAATRRSKEIGIRKVLGASVRQIVLLLSQRFVGMVMLALILAAPVVLLVMRRWLATFAYRVDISWSVFLITGAIALIITIFTVSIHAMKAALANPTTSLRYE